MPVGGIVTVDFPGAAGGEGGMLDQPELDALISRRQPVPVELQFFPRERHLRLRQGLGARQQRQGLVTRGDHGHLVTVSCQRSRQVANNIANTADLAARQCAVFSGDHEDVHRHLR